MKKSKVRLVALAATLGLGIALTSSHATSQPAAGSDAPPTKEARDEAATRYRKGVELFKEADYSAALIEFRRAYELAPNYNVLYNIGQVYFQLQDYANALTALERYMAEGGKNIPKARKEDVEKDLEKLRSRVATIEVAAAVADADVSVDDVPVGKTPLAKPLMVSAGRHKISATKEGYRTFTKFVEVASSDSAKLTIDLVEQKSGTPEPQPTATTTGTVPPPIPSTTASTSPTTPSKPPEAPPPIPWAGWAVTGGLAAGAVITGVLALGASSDLKSTRSGTPTKETLTDMASDVSTKALVSDILTGCAVVAGGVSLILTIRSVSASKAAADTSAPAGSPPTTSGLQDVRFGIGPGSVSISGSF